MNVTSVKVSLDTRRQKADGTYPLILRLSHKRKTTSLKTGIYLKEQDWDDKNLVVKKSYKGTVNVTRLNNEIQKKKAEALDKVLQLGQKQPGVITNVTDVKAHIAPKSSSQSFYDFGAGLIKNLKLSERIGTARSYEGVISVLKTFNKGQPLQKNLGGNPKETNNVRFSNKSKNAIPRDLSFDEINFAFLQKLESYHLSSGNDVNGLAVYMRTIRSIYNQAIKAGIAEKSLYPFSDYKIKTKPTKKRALEKSDIAKIISCDFPQDHRCFNARNYFVASYMMYGMNFADMAHLKKTDVIQNRVNYRRKKTSKIYDIKVGEDLKKIFEYYGSQIPESEYVFPIIKRETATQKERDIQTERKLFNRNLKEIAKLCGIEQNLTSYVSRHSFATNAMLTSIPINAISTMLGHSSLKTTEIYLKSLPTNILDDYNSHLITTTNKFLKQQID